VRNEILLEIAPDTPQSYTDTMARTLRLTLLESQTFALTGRTLQRWRIDGTATVRATLIKASGFARVSAAQPNFVYRLMQTQPSAATDSNNAQFPNCI
jgi:meiotically up-regulated gene 157 (Mug157) protein